MLNKAIISFVPSDQISVYRMGWNIVMYGTITYEVRCMTSEFLFSSQKAFKILVA